MSKMIEFLKCERGATAIEYAMIAAGTGLVLIAVAPSLEASLSATFNSLNAGFK